MIDQRETRFTGFGAALTLSLAGPIPRAAAWLVDFFIRALLYLALAVLFAYLGAGGNGLLLVTLFLLEWGYPVLFEALWNGQTPGKRWLNIAVIQTHGGPVSWNSAMTRNLLRVADFFPVGYATGLITMLMNKRFQRLGDLAADTLVIHLPTARPATTRAIDLPADTPQQADWPLGLADKQAFANFIERHQGLSVARQQELAGILFPHDEPAQALNKVKAIAVGVVGGQ